MGRYKVTEPFDLYHEQGGYLTSSKGRTYHYRKFSIGDIINVTCQSGSLGDLYDIENETTGERCSYMECSYTPRWKQSIKPA